MTIINCPQIRISKRGETGRDRCSKYMTILGLENDRIENLWAVAFQFCQFRLKRIHINSATDQFKPGPQFHIYHGIQISIMRSPIVRGRDLLKYGDLNSMKNMELYICLT